MLFAAVLFHSIGEVLSQVPGKCSEKEVSGGNPDDLQIIA